MLIFAYCIPEKCLYENAQKSVAILEQEGIRPLSSNQGKLVDNFTTAIMINEAVYPVENPIVDSLAVSHSAGGSTQIENARKCLEGEYEPIAYYRYWHGYLVYLKPLLMFFDLYEIRLLFQICLVFLLIGSCYAFSYRFGKFGIVFGSLTAFSFLVFGCVDAVSALPMFPAYVLSLLGSIVLLRKDHLNSFTVLMAFMILGALTVYFDFLDNPILTLGVPLACLLLRRSSERSFSIKDAAKTIACCSLCWLGGYGGLWVIKWLLASMILGVDAFANATSSATTYLGMSDDGRGNSSSPLGALILNWNYMGGVRWLMLLTAFCAVMAFAALVIRHFGQKNEADHSRISYRRTCVLVVALGVVALFPYVWMIVLSHHSSVHYWFVYRDQIITLLCLLFCNVISVKSCFIEVRPEKPDDHSLAKNRKRPSNSC